MSVIEDKQHYEDERFSQLALPRTRFSSVEFHNCIFERCTFTESTFYRCKFVECRFTGCDLSLLQIPNCTFMGTRFERSKLVGIDWTKAGHSAAARIMFSVGFADCVLDYGSFFGLSLRQMKFERCSAKEADFSEADLTGADCRGTDFSSATFLHTNLEQADFRDARNYDIDPQAAKVKGAKFSLPDAVALLRSFGVVIEL